MVTSPFRALIFDLDGTLIDSRVDIAAAANHVLQAAGRPTLLLDTLASFVGDGAGKLMERASGLRPEDAEFAPLLAAFSERYLAHAVDATVLYPGVRTTLEQLRRIRPEIPLALCTNKPRAITDRILQLLQLSPYFAVVVGGDDFAERKPDPRPVLEICKQLAVSPRDALMVGDGPQDMVAGKRAGARTAGVSFGFKSEEMFAHSPPDYRLDTFRDVLDLV